MRKRRDQDNAFREDYWLNTTEYRPDMPGIHLHSFCHSLLTPQWHPLGPKRYRYIQVSIILSGKQKYITHDGVWITNAPNFFQITDLNEAADGRQYRHTTELERYFILLHVNRVLRTLLYELFPAGLPGFMPSDPFRLKTCFEDIRHCLRKKGPSDNTMLGALVFRLLLEASMQNTKESRIQETLSTALRLIDNEFCDPELTRERVAAAAGISVVSLGKLFRSSLQTTARKYITDLRLEKACKMLNFSEISIAQIAEQCGFTSHSYFTKVFRKNFGCTPFEFRMNGFAKPKSEKLRTDWK